MALVRLGYFIGPSISMRATVGGMILDFYIAGCRILLY